jgi:hypothetical protein
LFDPGDVIAPPVRWLRALHLAMFVRRFHFMQILMFLLLLLAPAMQAAAAVPLTVPPAQHDRLKLNVGMIVVDIRNIDDVAQEFDATLIIYLSWRDPRLASDGGETRTFPLNEIWSPRYQVSNEVLAHKRYPEQLQVAPDGKVVYIQRLSGSFSARLDLREFPFDAQQLDFRLTFPDFEPQRLELVPDSDFSGILRQMSIAGWSVGAWHLQSDPINVLRNITRSSALMSFKARRSTGYYLWKIIMPLVLIVFMSWTVFWISPENAGPPIGLATTSMLTLIAYRFILGSQLPRVSYLTLLDYFILGSTVLVFMALLEVVITSGLAQAGKSAQAHRLQRAARLVFPLLFGVLIIAVFTSQLRLPNPTTW